MICVPRWWLAALYFLVAGSQLHFAREETGFWMWLSLAAAAFFFIGLAFHTGRLLQSGWRRVRGAP